MHSHKCDHVKFELAHSQKMVANAVGRSLEYPIPDHKYPILELESIFDSQI